VVETRADPPAAEVCPHKKFVLDNLNKGTCPECGEVRQFTHNKQQPYIVLQEGKLTEDKKRPGQNNQEKHRWYEKHKDDIVRDLLTKGRTFTRHKWKIPSPSIFVLEQRWLTAEQIAQVEKTTTTEFIAVDNGQLPEFPKFGDTWPEAVQLKWLEIYEKLIEGTGKPEK